MTNETGDWEAREGEAGRAQPGEPEASEGPYVVASSPGDELPVEDDDAVASRADSIVAGGADSIVEVGSLAGGSGYTDALPPSDGGVHAPPPIAPVVRTRPSHRYRGLGGLALVLLIGLGVRLPMVCQDGLGHEPDMKLFRDWTRSVTEHGLTGFYEHTRWCNYPPTFVLSWWGLGSALEAVADDGVVSEHLLHAALKVPASLCDLLIAVVLFIEGRRLLGPRRAVGAAALYFLNPVVIYNSAYWGQVDSVHTLLVLLAVWSCVRKRWAWAGAAIGAALLTKFQSIAFLPLVLLEPYRQRGWRSVGMVAIGMVLAAVPILAPFAVGGVLDDVMTRAYTEVVGQYDELSTKAFNVWYWLGTPEVPDGSVPHSVAAVAAGGTDSVSVDGSLLMWLTWRRVSLIAYAAVVALILSIHTYLRAPLAWYATAGLLGLAFFAIPTEMHERYAHPAFALLAIWAVGGPWRERMYILISVLLVLNYTFPQPVEAVGSYIGAGVVISLAALIAWLAVGRMRSVAVEDRSPPPEIVEPLPPARSLIRIFRIASFSGCAVLAIAGIAVTLMGQVRDDAGPDDRSVFLSTIQAESSTQGWGTLQHDRSVLGGVLRLGDTVYLRGLGTHAPSRVEYEIPPGYANFVAVVGIDAGSRGAGSAVAKVLLDGEAAFESAELTAESAPLEVRVPLGEARRITLVAGEASGGQKSDHFDWALARFERTP
jgi:Gpi18-like mannosyltransferase